MKLLRLRLSPINELRFQISASGAGEAEAESILPFFDNDINRLNTLIKVLNANNFCLKHYDKEELDWMIRIAFLKEDKSHFHPDLLVNIGKKVFQALFPADTEVGKILERAITLAEDNRTQLHMQLEFYANPEHLSPLAYYPWELVHNGQKFLASDRVTFSRYIAYGSMQPKILPVNKINVLLISSAAFDIENGLGEFTSKEQQAIGKGIRKAKQSVSLTKLKIATFNELRAYLTENQGNKAPHVIHFDGHGEYGKRCINCERINPGIKLCECKWCASALSSPEGYLLFEGNEGKVDYVSASKLGDLIQQTSLAHQRQQNILLLVLSACKSGVALAGDSNFNGIAQNLISRHIPAVVAMQYLISIDAATTFSEQFYRSLGQKNPLTSAVSNGREAMGFESNQWYRPVLYLRWKDNEGGQIFTLPSTSVEREIGQVIQEVSHRLDSTLPERYLLDISRENARKRSEYRKQAESWLMDKSFRLDLASSVAKKTLKIKSLGIYPSRLAQREAQEHFKWNLYNCLNCLLRAFQNGTGENIDTFIQNDLSQHPLEIYVTGLSLFKAEVEHRLSDNREVIQTIYRYTDILIDQISKYI